MSDEAGKAVGSLVVRNGKHRGTLVPVKLPVTMIGHGEHCDVRLTGEGIAAWHCCLALTPAGLAVRSWHAAETLVNGEPTAAAVLAHGDTLQVGPCQFRVAWNGPIATETGSDPADDAEFHLKEREESLHEQERQLAAVLDARHKQTEALLTDLDAGREELRKEKLAHKSAADEAKRLRAEVVRDRKLAGDHRAKARAVYATFLVRMKKRWSAEKNAVASGRADILVERHALEAEREAFAAERRAFVTDAELYKRRLAEAWELSAEGHKRLLADRAAVDETIRMREESVAAREAAVATAEQAALESRDTLRAESEKLLAEVSGLESRAFHLNLKVQELEQARSAATASLAVATAAGADTPLAGVADLSAPVPLDRRRDKSFEQLVHEIAVKEQELAKEQQAVAKAKAAFDGLAKELADQRSVLTEQFSKLAAARDLWHRAETVTVQELEDLARAVDRREKLVASREQAGARTDEDRLKRQQELVRFRLKLEGWQAGLTAHETGWYAMKDHAEAELDRKRELLVRNEQALNGLAAEWAVAWKKERDGLKSAYSEFLTERVEIQAKTAALDKKAADLTKQAQAVAAVAVAAEAAKAELVESAGRSKAEKRLRVTRKGWEKHFAKVGKDLDARRTVAQKTTEKLETKYREMEKTIATLADRTAATLEKERAVSHKKLKEDRDAADRAVILSIETARRKRSERAVEELRDEVDRVAKVLLTTEVPVEEVVSLAQAA